MNVTLTFSAHGTYPWTIPAGITALDIKCVGSGAGGSGNSSTAGLSGGGAGGYSETTALSVSTSDAMSIVVGQGGAAGNNTTSTAGAQTKVTQNGTTECLANGGGATASSGATAGNGGSATGATGNTKNAGGGGGTRSGNTGGGGGGPGTSGGTGTAGSGSTGGGSGNNGGANGVAGSSGTGAGNGGGGGGKNAIGAAGNDGSVVISFAWTSGTQFIPPAGCTVTNDTASTLLSETWAGGGGGDAGSATNDGNAGDGGSYASNSNAVTSSSQITFAIGAAGTGDTGGGPTSGGNSSVTIGASMVAQAIGGFGGGGGGEGSGTGSVTYAGGLGGIGEAAWGGGGGGSGCASAVGGNGANATTLAAGAGGTSGTGGGAGGGGGPTVGANGANGSAPGGAGGGGSQVGNGGNGAAGQVALTWTVAASSGTIPSIITRRYAEDDPPRQEAVFRPPPLQSLSSSLTQHPGIRTYAAATEPDTSPSAYIARTPPPTASATSIPKIPWTATIHSDDADIAVPPPSIRFGPPGPAPLNVVPQGVAQTHRDELPPDAPVILFGPRLIDFGPRQASARGLYRIFNASEYRFYYSDSAPPVAGTSPQATDASLPFTTSDTFADGTWYLSLSYFDGVLDSGFLPLGPMSETYLVMVLSGGALVGNPPGGPLGATLALLPGGVVRIAAYYLKTPDGANAATTWAIAYTIDGSTPPSGDPGITKAMTAGPMQVLSYSLPAQVAGTTVKVQLQTYNGTTYSVAGAVMSLTIPSSGPAAPLDLNTWPGALPTGLE